MRTLSKILVANRGEIACRIIASAKAKGYRTVAVHSEADVDGRHVALADESVLLGPPPPAQSYLDIERIIAAARLSGADAVHPGYGFLSERASFAEACADAGLIFIGPDPDAIRVMGDKAESKRRMIAAGVPCIPGYQGDDQSEATLVGEAGRIGYPVMVKASAGGGGRGMRLVDDPAGLPAALRTARSEAESAFGDGRLLLERAITGSRHVEIQVFGDRHGAVIHLGERDCSVQRRHQKVIEEAPSPAVDPQLRARMGEAAARAAAAINYVSAGTVEFLLAPDGAFYFLEMNTRLQVEHPVTEMVTGLDLVGLQFHVAEGRPLPFAQDDVRLTGHAIEVRLYAEDPANDFLPQTGRIELWRPAGGEGVRIDHGLRAGAGVSPHYDPMLAKIIAWGQDREEARRRLIRAVENTRIFGVATNRAFLCRVLEHPVFAAGEASTDFIGRHFPDGFVPAAPPPWGPALAVALFAERGGAGWRSNLWSAHPIRIEGPGGSEEWAAERHGAAWRLTCGEAMVTLRLGERDGSVLRFGVDGHALSVGYHLSEADHAVELDWRGLTHRYRDLSLAPPEASEGADSHGVLRAPMSGLVTKVEAAQGDRVTKGQLVLVLEAMKMEHQIIAPIDGVIEMLRVAPGAQVGPRDTLAVIAADAAR